MSESVQQNLQPQLQIQAHPERSGDALAVAPLAAPLVLFLDFDGVLHPDPCFNEPEFSSLHLVEAVLANFPSVEIVVSSAWRTYHTLAELREFLGPTLGPRIVGLTPDLELAVVAFPRQTECETWLRAHRPDSLWIAIDDRDWWFKPNIPNLLLTDCTVAFRLEHAEPLRKLIEERLS
jgi:hypothetical protein